MFFENTGLKSIDL
ncbi:MAG TPA: hypothetical protein EYN63_02165 [Candidatus Lambdaproteobacteria bacterium]|nr:MAG: hypothetical protein DSY97_00570 [SAR324 cluster bacterium]HHZ85944.1 hypothetical protein [Candidatus Lambdaproteobacteria bacterium]HIC06986.1 hypothetical protein [Candidatus Lambdaproteobacteria bacterium]HIN00104.1 hypothetical protein [Deltaproteobacteria bacterium]HIP64095.1 hypothetical protein [Deltaproteobacteria bacterium]